MTERLNLSKSCKRLMHEILQTGLSPWYSILGPAKETGMKKPEWRQQKFSKTQLSAPAESHAEQRRNSAWDQRWNPPHDRPQTYPPKHQQGMSQSSTRQRRLLIIIIYHHLLSLSRHKILSQPITTQPNPTPATSNAKACRSVHRERYYTATTHPKHNKHTHTNTGKHQDILWAVVRLPN